VPPVALVLPGSLASRTGGSIYDRRIVDGLRGLGWAVEVRELDSGFPFPSARALGNAADSFAAIPSGTLTIVDSLALGAIPEILEGHARRLRLVALMHLPLAADIGLDRETMLRFAVQERRALASSVMVIVTGRATLPLLDGYGVPPSRIAIVEPGTDRMPPAGGSSGSPLRLLSVATLNPGKGHGDLLTALAAVPSRDWHLTCAGSCDRDPLTASEVRSRVRRMGLEDRVTLTGELDEPALAALYLRSDLFVLATRRETYGMAVAEALSYGLPVVSTRTGAIPDLVGDEAGVLVEPRDVYALGDALARVIGDPALRARLAAGAHRVSATLTRWERAVAQLAAALETITP
jgi:glycosyltransferase involved in cell wall biosynthesis